MEARAASLTPFDLFPIGENRVNLGHINRPHSRGTTTGTKVGFIGSIYVTVQR